MRDAVLSARPPGARSGEDGGTPDFGQELRWRAEAAVALGLRGDERRAAMSPGAAYPPVLRTICGSLHAPVTRIADIGAGGGGSSDWLRASTGALVVAVDESAGACAAAAEMFPELLVVRGRASASGLVTDGFDLVTVCGVLSLLHDPTDALHECRRLVRAGGMLAVADLHAGGSDDLTDGPNTFRTVPSVSRLLAAFGFVTTAIGCGESEPARSWASIAAVVEQWIAERHGHDVAYAAMQANAEHLRRCIDAADLVGACVVARLVS